LRRWKPNCFSSPALVINAADKRASGAKGGMARCWKQFSAPDLSPYVACRSLLRSVKITWPFSWQKKGSGRIGRCCIGTLCRSLLVDTLICIRPLAWRFFYCHDENYASKVCILEAPRPLFLRHCSTLSSTHNESSINRVLLRTNVTPGEVAERHRKKVLLFTHKTSRELVLHDHMGALFTATFDTTVLHGSIEITLV